MASYYMNEAAFELPERPFEDATVHALEAKLPSGEQLAVFVHRSPVHAGQTLRALVDGHVALNATRLARFGVIDEAPVTVGGLDGLRLRTRFRSDGEALLHDQLHVIVGGQWLVFAATAPEGASTACDAVIDALLRTIAWRV